MSSYDALLLELQKTKDQDSNRSFLLFREFLADVVPNLDHGFSTMSACVSVAPLLGLLGTISGMNRMFAVITDVGLGSPSLMAGGISVALGSALAGLAVAVVIMFFHNYLYNKKAKCLKMLMVDGEKIVRGAFPS
jgi:biopolymer transport protein ExbB